MHKQSLFVYLVQTFVVDDMRVCDGPFNLACLPAVTLGGRGCCNTNWRPGFYGNSVLHYVTSSLPLVSLFGSFVGSGRLIISSLSTDKHQTPVRLDDRLQKSSRRQHRRSIRVGGGGGCPGRLRAADTMMRSSVVKSNVIGNYFCIRLNLA